MMHSFYWTHVVFGLFLIYTGIKSATISDEHFDPRESSLFVFACKYIRLVNTYDDKGRLFILAKVDPNTGDTITPEGTISTGENKDAPKRKDGDLEKAKLFNASKGYGSTEQESGEEYRWHGTLLVLVVMCILITDLIFAVDSVSAVVAEVPDLFLAYTASVFAVLNLRAMFFVTDKLIHMFVLLKYGIASILVIIGVKLMLKEWIHIPALVMIGLLVSIVALCIIGSVLLNRYQAWRERNSPQQRNTSPEQTLNH
jgi:predicted tellurium resistance membrane protein TerC